MNNSIKIIIILWLLIASYTHEAWATSCSDFFISEINRPIYYKKLIRFPHQIKTTYNLAFLVQGNTISISKQILESYAFEEFLLARKINNGITPTIIYNQVNITRYYSVQIDRSFSPLLKKYYRYQLIRARLQLFKDFISVVESEDFRLKHNFTRSIEASYKSKLDETPAPESTLLLKAQ